RVALKVPHRGAEGSVVQRFMREARAAANLRHPNLCPVHDVGEIDGVLYLTMAYIEGEPLSARPGQVPPLSAARSVELVALVARAMAHAHEQGVVHRDLKPSNILLDRSGQPIVVDFGVARLRTDDAVRTAAGVLLGSPAYMAPEQAASAAAA